MQLWDVSSALRMEQSKRENYLIIRLTCSSLHHSLPTLMLLTLPPRIFLEIIDSFSRRWRMIILIDWTSCIIWQLDIRQSFQELLMTELTAADKPVEVQVSQPTLDFHPYRLTLLQILLMRETTPWCSTRVLVLSWRPGKQCISRETQKRLKASSLTSRMLSHSLLPNQLLRVLRTPTA